jgi:DNA-binding MarR family transcriptional regulator
MDALSPNGAAFTDLVLEVFRVNRLLLDAGDALTAPAGLTSARWQVLGVVEHGPATVAEVARTMGLTRQSVQQTADGLARDGLLTFAENPRHRRAKLMVMTPKARAALDVVVRRHAGWANAVGDGLDPQALAAALATLRQLRAALEAAAPGDPATGPD